MAERLAQDFGSVKYWSHWMTGFSEAKDFLPGLGLPEVERIADIYDVYDEIDCAIFTDVGAGGIQERMRKDGIAVFGCGRAQVLELDRYYFRQSLQEKGMAVANYEVVIGLEELRKVLKKRRDCYVKFSYFRSSSETFHAKHWPTTQLWLDDLAVILGPYGYIAHFLIEDPIDGEAIEVGADIFAVNGEIPENGLWGYEQKDSCFLGTTNPMPDRLRYNTLQFAEILKEYNYRGVFSTEVRVTKDEEYLTDPTMRFPSPPSELECAMMTNFSDVVWEGAHGNLIEPQYSHRYGAMLVLKSEWIIEHALAVDFGRSDRVYLHGHFRIDGKDFSIVPEEFGEFAGAVGVGDSLEGAIEEAIDAAESVSAHQLQFSVSSLNDAMEAIEKGNDLGLTWSGAPKLKMAIGE